MTKRDQDLRREERVSAALPVDLGTATGITRDVSASGIFLEMDASYAFGSTMDLTVEFETPGGNIMFKCHGTIVRIEPHGSRAGVAVKIIESTMEPVIGPATHRVSSAAAGPNS